MALTNSSHATVVCDGKLEQMIPPQLVQGSRRDRLHALVSAFHVGKVPIRVNTVLRPRAAEVSFFLGEGSSAKLEKVELGN